MRAVLAVTLAAMLATLVVAAPAPGGIEEAVAYLESRQQPGGGFAEPGGRPDPGLTAWAVLGLTAAGARPSEAAAYLTGQPYPAATDLELRILALDALDRDTAGLARQLEALRRRDGSIGPLVNSTIWGMIALRAAGRPVDPATVRFLRRAQRADGGWSWCAGVAADSERHRRRDPGAACRRGRSELEGDPPGACLLWARSRTRTVASRSRTGRGSDAQSTSWAIQAFLAAGRSAPAGVSPYLLRLQRAERELPLQRALRDDAGLGHGAGRRRRSPGARSRLVGACFATGSGSSTFGSMTPPMAPQTAQILTIGNEIVSGDVENTNGSWLARRLAELGVEVRLMAALRDEIEPIGAFLAGREHVDHVFVTGGLGGTPDDITREAVAAAFERRLRRDRRARRAAARALRPPRAWPSTRRAGR